MRTSEKTEQVAASLFAVHRDLINPRKDSRANAGKFSYTYLSLPALIEHLRPILKEYQLFATQDVRGDSGYIEVSTVVWHLSGQFIEFGPLGMPGPADPQQRGSAITYARRYALAAVFNLAADEDDDGASAVTAQLPAEKGRGGSHAPSQVTTSPPANSGAVPSGENARSSPAPDTGTADPKQLLSGERVAEDAAVPVPSTDGLWANLLSAVDGKTKTAAEIINKANGTTYTYPTARAGATWDELVAAIASVEVPA